MTEDGTENVKYYDALASMYHLFFQNLEGNMEEEGDWLHDVLGEWGARTVLDASCGTGRQAIPLAQRGYVVMAADPSGAMLQVAQAEADRQGLSIAFVHAPFAALPRELTTRADAVVAMGNGLCNLAHPDEIRVALGALRRCCRDGGGCVVGIKDFGSIRCDDTTFHEHRVATTPEGRAVLFELWNCREPILEVTAQLLRERVNGPERRWETLVAETREYMLSPEELRALAHQSGFREVYRLDHPSEAAFLLRT